MRQIASRLIVSLLTLLISVALPARFAAAANAPATKASNLGPTVVKSEPATLANDVDPGLTSINVTFDQAMADHSWSWTGGGETFPKDGDGKISYDAKHMTCTLPVKLEPGKVYFIGINSPSHRNFKSATGKAAQRYALCFATKSADGKPTPIPQDMLDEAKDINSAVGMGEPIVMRSTPKALSDNVAPTVSKITVTFDQAMHNGSWSWVGGGDTFPKDGVGKVSYDATLKTCTLPVKLEPGKVYWVGINSPSFQNFQNRAGSPARRYVILFATASADGKPTPIPDDMLKEAKQINAISGSPEADTEAEKK